MYSVCMDKCYFSEGICTASVWTNVTTQRAVSAVVIHTTHTLRGDSKVTKRNQGSEKLTKYMSDLAALFRHLR